VKFGKEEQTAPPCQISPLDRRNVSPRPLRGEKPNNRPVSKNNTGRAALLTDPAGKNKFVILKTLFFYRLSETLHSNVTLFRFGLL